MSKVVDELRAALALAEAAEQRRASEAARAALAAVGGAVPPVWFERPRRAKTGEPGARDPYFQRASWDWDAEITAGFEGWMQGNGRGVILIHFPAAVLWFEQKLKAAQESRGQGSAAASPHPQARPPECREEAA